MTIAEDYVNWMRLLVQEGIRLAGDYTCQLKWAGSIVDECAAEAKPASHYITTQSDAEEGSLRILYMY